MDTTLDATLREMRERVIAAHQERRPLRLRGAGTKDFYGETLEGESVEAAARAEAHSLAPQLLDLRPYHGIVDYEPSELVITARCGTPLSEIETALAERGQFLAFEPPACGGGDPTIGGVVAAGLSGPRRVYVGAARDFVLGATLLDARGDLLRFGGQVMKNVAGFDVSRLLCGSLGVLGVITEVSLKVLPQPRAEETLRFELPAREAVDAFNRWSGQPLRSREPRGQTASRTCASRAPPPLYARRANDSAESPSIQHRRRSGGARCATAVTRSSTRRASGACPYRTPLHRSTSRVSY